MAASTALIFGDFSSTPKSSKSLKGASGLFNQQIMPRSPLTAMNSNRRSDVQHQQAQQNTFMSDTSRSRQFVPTTPGPPPKASLSLMGGMALQKDRNISTPLSQITTKQSIAAGISTPVPVASPSFLDRNKSNTTRGDSLFGEAQISSFATSESHWVVAHGYSSSTEYNELSAILSSFGRINMQEASGNWLAVQFESRLAAEKALCNQPILLTNSLCGIVRGSPSLLHKLNNGKQQPPNMTPNKGKTIETNKKTLTIGKLEENDILLLENRASRNEDQRNKERSVCDKLAAWYFGWDDDEHPHSD